MGLDISAYSKLTSVDHEFLKIRERVPGVFSQLGEEIYDITKSMIDSPNNWIQDMEPGSYYESADTEVLDFRAGSYSGYNEYRKLLSECFLGVQPNELWTNERRYEGKPFYEQINFSDCEGFIGPKVSAKLHEDYKKGRDQWYEFLRESFGGGVEEIKWRMDQYDNWTKAFGIAADGGLVWYH
jgi:hypothetical protein